VKPSVENYGVLMDAHTMMMMMMTMMMMMMMIDR
jgi:hypothetical protein